MCTPYVLAYIRVAVHPMRIYLYLFLDAMKIRSFPKLDESYVTAQLDSLKVPFRRLLNMEQLPSFEDLYRLAYTLVLLLASIQGRSNGRGIHKNCPAWYLWRLASGGIRYISVDFAIIWL